MLESAIYGRWWGGLAYRIRHLLNRNTRAGSRRNIHAHYDLGNPFYRLWLDPSMTYSSALFDGDRDGDGTRSLEQAQQAKYRRILDELALEPGASVLEIGCGWGGFAELAARDGLQVRGLTLSTEQLAHARERLAGAGLAGRAEFALQDYRDEHGTYDGIASIEMFEAVGESYWPAYFDTLRRCLAPDGRAVVQTITIDDALFERYRRSTDFIQQYVFPGGMLPRPSVFETHARNAGLRIVRTLAFGQDYARTLALWRERLRRADRAGSRAGLRPEIRAHLGLLPRLLRGGLQAREYRRVPVHAGPRRRPMTATARLEWPDRIGAAALALRARALLLSAAIVLGTIAVDAQGVTRAQAPAAVASTMVDARLCGEGVLRWFGLKVYEARLWVAGDGFDPARFSRSPFALDLRYARALEGEAIAKTSLDEITRLGFGDPQRRSAWFDAMRGIFPDVRDGDRLTGVNRPGGGVQFYRNDQRIGTVADPEFAAAFFAIWLDPRTTAPALRASLLDSGRAAPGSGGELC